jgi:hypothetical protein
VHWLDWLILLGTLGFIEGYSMWKTRNSKELSIIFTTNVNTTERNNPRK